MQAVCIPSPSGPLSQPNSHVLIKNNRTVVFGFRLLETVRMLVCLQRHSTNGASDMTTKHAKPIATNANLFYLYFANGRRPDGFWLDHEPTADELRAYATAGLALATVGRTYTFTRKHDFGDYQITRTELLDASGEVCQVRDITY